MVGNIEDLFTLLAGAGRLPGQRKGDGSWRLVVPIEISLPHGCNCVACAAGPKHWSDCAVHNEPAYPNGPCDCNVGGTDS